MLMWAESYAPAHPNGHPAMLQLFAITYYDFDDGMRVMRERLLIDTFAWFQVSQSEFERRRRALDRECAHARPYMPMPICST